MILYATLSIGCWECCEQTEVLYIGHNLEKAREPLLKEIADYPGTKARPQKIEPGANFPMDINSEKYHASCVEHVGRLEIHQFENINMLELGPPKPTAKVDEPPRDDSFWVPDESGEGGEWSYPGDVYWEPDALRWYVREDRYRSRSATTAEVEKAEAEAREAASALASLDASAPASGPGAPDTGTK
jgi:hypothetical protein